MDKHIEIWNRARKLKLGVDFYNGLDVLLTEIESENKQLILHNVVVPKGTLFCENVIHHTCKHFDDIIGCNGCLVKDFEAK